MTLRHQITEALKTRLQTITVAGGYATGAGASVFVWRKTPITAPETPCLLVNDSELARDYAAPGYIGQVKNTLTCSLLAVAVDSKAATPALARLMEGDIVKCLAGWETAGGLAVSVLVTRSAPTMEQHDQLVGMVALTVEIIYSSARDQC